MKSKKLLTVVLSVLLVVALLTGTAVATGAIKGLVSSVSTDKTTYSKGDIVTVTISNDAMAKYAYTYNISFDKEKLECQSVVMKQGSTSLTNMTAYTGGILSVYSTPAEANASGKVGFALVDPNGAAVQANDITGVITFKVLYDGTSVESALTLNEDVAGSNSSGNITAEQKSTAITITLGGGEHVHVWTPTVVTKVVDGGSGNVTMTCSCGETAEYTQFAMMNGTSLVLDGTIAVKFYVILPSSADHITLNDESIAVSAMTAGSGEHSVKFNIPAKMIQDEAVLKVFDADNNPIVLLNSKGTQVLTEGYAYSPMTYIQNKATGTNEKLAVLVKGLNDYGMSAKAYFNYKPEVAAAAYYNTSLSSISVNDLAAFASTRDDDSMLPSGLQYTGSSIVLESATEMKFYFKVTSGAISDYKFTVDGTVVTPVKSGSEYYIKVANIAAKDLGNMRVIKATAKNSNTGWTITYSPLTYAYNKLNSSSSTDALKTMCRALYCYYNGAVAYFTK